MELSSCVVYGNHYWNEWCGLYGCGVLILLFVCFLFHFSLENFSIEDISYIMCNSNTNLVATKAEVIFSTFGVLPQYN
jgi:hypothetical protein